MKALSVFVFLLATAVGALAQVPFRQTVEDAQKEFEQQLTTKGSKQAFTSFLTSDSVVFQPDATNGRTYWASKSDMDEGRLVRKAEFSDVSSNGMVAYTTGKWEWFRKGKDDAADKFGQFVTVWVKRQGGRFQIAVDMTTDQDDNLSPDPKAAKTSDMPGVPNKQGWSAADPSMNFLKAAMSESRLGGAYQQWAADDIRLIREGDPPLIGKKKVVAAMRDYQSISYPTRVVLNEAADLAYVWNPCEYANSDEGVEKGNCLHIWKLRGKKWWIVLGIVSRVRNEKRPELKVRPKSAKPGESR